MMKASVKEARCKVALKDVDMPQLKEADDVLVKVTRAGVCGSDVYLWALEDRIGLIMGHEFCGTVEDPGQSDFKKGERVIIIPNGPKGLPTAPGIFAPGGYAEYFVAKDRFLVRTPDTIDDDTGAMIEPSGISYRAVKEADVKLGDRVLVTGAGIIGLLAVEWAKARGARYVALTEINEKRIATAKELSPADGVFNAKDPEIAEKLVEAAGGKFDKIIECTAVAESVNLGIKTVRHSGTIILVGVGNKGITIDDLSIVLNDITVKGMFGGVTLFEEVIDLLSLGLFDMKKYITKYAGLEDVQEILEDLATGDSEQIKVMLKP